MEKKKLEEVKKCLVVVDMINGFINEGTLADSYIRNIIDENVRLIKEFIKNNNPIIAFNDAHTKLSPELQRYPTHCLDGEYESALIDELQNYKNYFVTFAKNSTSGFVLPEFRKYIEKLKNLKEVIITGCCTDICVVNLAIPLKNYFDQYNQNIKVIVPKNAVETYDAPWHNRDEWNEMAFKFMSQAGIETPATYKKER